MSFDTNILFLSKADVDQLITPELVVDAVEKVFIADGQGGVCTPSKEIMRMDAGGVNALFAMPGYIRDLGVAGVKWTNFYPCQPDGLPTCWAHVLLLSDSRSGQPYAMFDATTITGMRTGGGHAVVAARALAKQNSETLAVLGCGAQAKAAIISFDRHFSLKKILLHSRSKDSFFRCREELKGELHAELCWAEDTRILTEQADILITATTSKTPLVEADQIPPGCFVAALYAFNDLAPAFSMKADKWILGHRDSDRIEILEEPDFTGKIAPGNVYSTLGEILCGIKPGRESDTERIVFTHMGMGALDIAVGAQLVEKAKALGMGQVLRLT
ncbi:MAG: ornithine cyclodeaminase family protein [Lachnospiraceae bacterium]